MTAEQMARVPSRGLHLAVFLENGSSIRRLGQDTSVTVGRAAECDVTLPRSSLSRRHFRVWVGSPATIRDLGSTNGTRVNGVRLEPNVPTPVTAFSVIEAGGAFFLLQEGDPSSAEAKAASPSVFVEDPAMARVHELVGKIARSTLPVLVFGETGVGKEVLSQAIHSRSPRAAMPFVGVNCAALPESLLESELFGYEKGAFTGATQAKRGLIESADGGTFFLDEVGELPLRTQAKLLRVLEAAEVMGLGAVRPRPIDVRFVAATNRDLPALVRGGGFRRDLYYRLNGMTIHVPPLRERAGQIASLAQLFVSSSARVTGPRPSLAPDTIRVLQRHLWPGNVRELRNVIDRALMLCEGDVLRPEHILLDDEPALETAPFAERPTSAPPDGLPRVHLDEEKRALLAALDEAGHNQRRAAEILKISRVTLMKWLDKHGVRRPRK